MNRIPPPPESLLLGAPVRPGWLPPRPPSKTRANRQWLSLANRLVVLLLASIVYAIAYAHSGRHADTGHRGILFDFFLLVVGHGLALAAASAVINSAPARFRDRSLLLAEKLWYVGVVAVYVCLIPVGLPLNAFAFIATSIGLVARVVNIIVFFGLELWPRPSRYATAGWFSQLAAEYYLTFFRTTSRWAYCCFFACTFYCMAFVLSAQSFFTHMTLWPGPLNPSTAVFLLFTAAAIPLSIVASTTLTTIREHARSIYAIPQLAPWIPVDDPHDLLQARRDRELVIRCATQKLPSDLDCFHLHYDSKGISK